MLAVLAALVVTLIVGIAPAASAHATVVSTTPGDGQVLASGPAAVSVRFDEPVELQFGALRVFSPSGARVDSGAPAHPAGRGDTVQVGLAGGLGRGTYTVAWRVVSADSHPVSGAFTFSVGAASAVAVAPGTLDGGGAGAGVGAVAGVVRGLAFGFYALLVGGVGFLVVCWPGGAAGAAGRRSRYLVGAGWAGLVGSTVAALAVQGPYDAGLGLGHAFDLTVLRTTASTRLGTALLVRLALLVVLGPGLVWLLPRLAGASGRMRVWAGAVGMVSAGAMAATWAAADHSGTGAQAGMALPADVAHLVAMGLWLGGLTVLAVAVLRPGTAAPGSVEDDRASMVAETDADVLGGGAGCSCPDGCDCDHCAADLFRRAGVGHFIDIEGLDLFGGPNAVGAADVPGAPDTRPPAADHLASAVRRFSPLAAACVAVLVATGSYQAWRQVGTPAALTGTAYGRLLLLKLLGVSLLLGLGYLGRLWIARHLLPSAEGSPTTSPLDPAAIRQLRRSVALEAVVACGVLALTAALVQARPARTAYTAPVSAAARFDTGGPAGSGTVQVFVTPARAGLDTVHVEVVGPDGRPKAVAQLTATLALPARDLGPLPVVLRADGSGHFTGTVTVPLAGAWRLAVTVRTDDVDETTVSVPVPVR